MDEEELQRMHDEAKLDQIKESLTRIMDLLDGEAPDHLAPEVITKIREEMYAFRDEVISFDQSVKARNA